MAQRRFVKTSVKTRTKELRVNNKKGKFAVNDTQNPITNTFFLEYLNDEDVPKLPRRTYSIGNG